MPPFSLPYMSLPIYDIVIVWVNKLVDESAMKMHFPEIVSHMRGARHSRIFEKKHLESSPFQFSR
jgi:hypothetical protein